MVMCAGEYDLDTGRYRGGVFVDELFSDEEGFSWDADRLSLGPVFKGSNGAETRVEGVGFVLDMAVSPARDRILTVEDHWQHSAPPSPFVVLRALPDLRAIAEVALEGDERKAQVGFFGDGTPVVLADASCHLDPCSDQPPAAPGCHRKVCDERSAFVVEVGGLRDLGGRFRGAAAFKASADGTRAVLSWPDHRELVELPKAVKVADLGAPFDETALADVALDTSGRRVAYFGREGFDLVGVRQAGAPEPLYRDPKFTSGSLRFSPDGRTLLAMGSDDDLLWERVRVRVLREGAPITWRPPFDYPVELPEGFEGGAVAPYATTYVGEHGNVEVEVTAGDTDEFGPPDTPIDQWAALVMERYRDGNDVDRPTTFEDSGRRSLEVARFRREGCEPADIYERYTEQGPLLYRIRMEVPPNTPKKRVLALMRTFFDAPKGAPTTARVLAKPPRTSREPC